MAKHAPPSIVREALVSRAVGAAELSPRCWVEERRGGAGGAQSGMYMREQLESSKVCWEKRRV